MGVSLKSASRTVIGFLLLATLVNVVAATQADASVSPSDAAFVDQLLPATEAKKVLGPDQVLAWGQKATLEVRVPASWERLVGPVGTVCLTGDDRVGKSTLLSYWISELVGPSGPKVSFAAGHTRTGFTRGLWSVLLPKQATGLDYHINLCDSQGLKQVSELEQWRLFSANVLVPSVLVYMLINVVQNDQIRDLAQFATQFQKIAQQDSARFNELLSPHLIVVIREESDFGGRSNASQHLEDALSSPGFEAEKALIRTVFNTREAWPLEELPFEARRAIRGGSATLERLPEALEYRRSAQEVLSRVRSNLYMRRSTFPRSGIELADWYESVATTVNSHDEGAMATLVNHAERLVQGKLLRLYLEKWRGPVILAMAVLLFLWTVPGLPGRGLDWAMWFAWLFLNVSYIGTSPFVTTSLGGFLLARLCDDRCVSRNSPTSFWSLGIDLVCRDASPHTAAVLVSIVFGITSYSLMIAAADTLMNKLPKAAKLTFAACLASEVSGGPSISALLAQGLFPDLIAMAATARTVLLVSTIWALLEVVSVCRQRYFLWTATKRGRDVHEMVCNRIEEVQGLQGSFAWRRHYRQHRIDAALWRYRAASMWWHVAVFGQTASLSAWGQLIYPRSDFFLEVGALVNLLGMVYRLCCWLPVGGWFGTRADDRGVVEEWLEELGADVDEEDDDCSPQQKVGDGIWLGAGTPIMDPETEEEKERRHQIEDMRIRQETEASRYPLRFRQRWFGGC